ncbi:MAG: hypothetical protein LUD68_06685 [Rikenellaceae bacterium]|nr:hypothetical protein [Rikenellaceae bacterium]
MVFEGSNDPLFSRTDTLHRIGEIPLGITEVNLDNDKPYRYIRVHPRSNSRLLMSEASFYGVNEAGEEVEITGELICHNIPEENARKLFDKNYLTSISARQNYYWVGLDLGANHNLTLSRIVYCPENDGNMIEPGDRYELFYYDLGWHSLGTQTAVKSYLVYDHAPANALFWLRNLTKGQEERIFTYENGKQIFW